LDANQNAAIEHAPQFAARLQKFGEPAKQELMKRAVGPEPVKHDWYRAPNFILRYWDDWSERDIEAVDRIIRDNPESPIGWAFVKIGTPRAIKTLVEDAAKYGAPYMPDMIAASFDKSLPYVDEGLAGEYWQFFVYLISDFEMRFALPKQHWLTALRDASQPDGKRIAALRAVSALKKLEPNERDALTPLLSDSHQAVRFEATRAVRALHGKVGPDLLAETCPVRPNALVTHPGFDEAWEDCLLDFANYGAAATRFGDIVVRRHLSSPNGADRMEGATALGLIGYKAAIPRLNALLDDQDWRVVFAATRALGWLGAKESIGALDRVASTHWLVEVRNYSRDVAAALRSAGAVPKPNGMIGTFGAAATPSPQNKFNIDAALVPDSDACMDSRWLWDGKGIVWRQGVVGFVTPDSAGAKIDIPAEGRLPPGALVGIDVRENGGRLIWTPDGGQPETLYSTNIIGMMRTDAGVIAVLGEWGPERDVVSNGPRGIGFAVRLNRDGNGKWHLSEIARFPRGVDGVTEISSGLYAASSGGRVIVFSSDHILGLAACAQ